MSPPDPTAAHDGKLCEVDNNGSCPMFSFVTTCISTKALALSPRGLNPTGEHDEILNEGCHFYNVAGNEVPHSVKDTQLLHSTEAEVQVLGKKRTNSLCSGDP